MNIKNVYVSCALLLMSACGDELQPASGDDLQTDAGNQLGSVQQALVTMPDGYGLIPNSDSIRCFNDGGRLDWPNDCYAPARKTATIVRAPNTCTGSNATLYKNMLQTAASDWKTYLSDAGWSIRVVDAVGTSMSNPLGVPSSESGRQISHLACGVPFSGSGSDATGGTKIETDLNCDETSAGDLCKFSIAQARLYAGRYDTLLANNIPASATAAQRGILVRSTFSHELGHTFGLGHDLCGNAPLTKLMAPLSPCRFNLNQPSSWVVSQPNSTERQWLRDFSR